MEHTATLESIKSGQASIEEARKAVERALVASDHETAENIYGALRGWTWKALTSRRFDDDLRSWHDLIRGASARMRRRHDSQADRLRVLSELIYESVQFANANPAAEVLKRSHVREILSLLRRSPLGEITREELLTATSLKQANLSRVLSIMASCGIVEREMYGRKTMVRLPLADRQRLQSHNLDQEVIPLKEGDRGLVAVPPREGSYKMVHQSKLTAEESSAGRLHTRDSNLGQRIYAFRIEQPGVSDLEFKTTSFQKLMPSSKYASRRRRAVFSPIPASMPRVTHG
jgi:DNA-binding transcriptional ArsR family regulator